MAHKCHAHFPNDPDDKVHCQFSPSMRNFEKNEHDTGACRVLQQQNMSNMSASTSEEEDSCPISPLLGLDICLSLRLAINRQCKIIKWQFKKSCHLSERVKSALVDLVVSVRTQLAEDESATRDVTNSKGQGITFRVTSEGFIFSRNKESMVAYWEEYTICVHAL